MKDKKLISLILIIILGFFCCELSSNNEVNNKEYRLKKKSCFYNDKLRNLSIYEYYNNFTMVFDQVPINTIIFDYMPKNAQEPLVLQHLHVYEYDSKGNKIKYNKYAQSFPWEEFSSFSTDYEYDDKNNNLLKETYKDESYFLYEYDKNRRLIKKSFFSDSTSSIPIYYEIYSYNDKGNLKEKYKYEKEMKKELEYTLRLHFTYDEYDEDNNIIKGSFYDSLTPPGEFEENYYIWEYDENNNMIKKSFFKKDGSLIDYYTWEYDENNNMIKKVLLDEESNLLIDYYTWEYDENNNMIKESLFNKKDGSLIEYCTYKYELECVKK